MIVLFVDASSEDYRFELKPLPPTIQQQKLQQLEEDEELFTVFSIGRYDSDSVTEYYYYNFSMSENGTASVSLNQTDLNSTLEIDEDGDDDVDRLESPDLIETNYLPNATIFSPGNNTVFLYGDEILFNGTGTDPEDGILNASSLVWTSNINGIIGFGNEVNTSELFPGAHTITLMVNDSADLMGTDSINIHINAPDFMLNSSDISFSTPNPTEGEIITINATVHNKGLVNATNVTVQFFDGILEFEIANVTINALRAGENEAVNATWDTTGKGGRHSIGVRIDSEDSISEMNETNNRASKSILINEAQPQITFFDTGSSVNPYPSISGIHNGTITPSSNITIGKLYTYSCLGTGGHTEYAALFYSNGTIIAEARWNGYNGDWHNISFNVTFVLYENETYNYTIRTGSYPQIIHKPSLNATGGIITCDKFIDVNGRVYYDWIPAIRLWAG